MDNFFDLNTLDGLIWLSMHAGVNGGVGLFITDIDRIPVHVFTQNAPYNRVQVVVDQFRIVVRIATRTDHTHGIRAVRIGEDYVAVFVRLLYIVCDAAIVIPVSEHVSYCKKLGDGSFSEIPSNDKELHEYIYDLGTMQQLAGLY